MGAVLALPLLGTLGSLAASATSACVGAAACFCTTQAASALTKSCNCNSSVATRIGFSIIFLLNSLLAWIMLTDYAINLVSKYTLDYIKMSCKEGRCYGVLAVHRICFALALFHGILALTLIGVKSTKSKRAAFQNGWWGPKIVVWLSLVAVTFAIPNGFFIFYSSYISLVGATIFILIGLVLLVDFAHSWSEMCLERWEETESNLWKFILIGSTLGLYVIQITLTALQYAFFAGSGCELNQFFISFNLALSIVVTFLSVHPAVQSANPRSGLAQSGMVVAYTAYLVTSAIANHDDSTGGQCNPLQSRAAGARNGMVVLGAVFTFLAIAYSTSRAATQSKALVGKKGGDYGAIALEPEEGEMDVVNTQPKRKDTLRYQALLQAVAAGSLPASALDESEDEDEDEDKLDDERSETRYNYVWFHVIFIMATMYVAMLLTNWNVVSAVSNLVAGSEGSPIKIGRSHTAMWMRIVSSWVCLGIYAWSLVAPLVLDRDF